MPWIDSRVVNCGVFLYSSAIAAEDRERWGGSGFLLGIRSEQYSELAHVYAVTNDHVCHSFPVVRHRLGVREAKDEDWIPHPDGDDVAVMPFGFLPWREWPFIEGDTLLSELNVLQMGGGPGDDCLMVGKFVVDEVGRQLDRPVVRFGNLAMMNEKIRQEERAFEQDSFLVDMRSLPGYSGSPVVLYWEKTAVMSWTVHATPDSIIGQRGVMDRSWLLGIDWGHPGRTQPVLDADGNPVPQGLRVRTNTGLSAVVPAWKLATLLELPELVASRHEAETTYAQQPDGAVPDS